MSIVRRIRLLLDKAAAKKVETDLKRQQQRIEREQQRTWRRIRGFILGAFSIAGIKRLTSELFRLGSAAEETGSKFRTVFGSESAAELDLFLEKFGKLAGLTKTEGRDMLAITGAIARGVGIASPEVAGFSEEILRLAGDLQSFHDVPIGETFAAIRGGVTGEMEPLKRFGIILRAADVDLRALANSQKNRAKDLTESERVTARLQIITERASVAIGDLERTQDSSANTARRLSTITRQFTEDVSSGLLPVFSLLLNAWAGVSSAADSAGGVISRVSQLFIDFVGGIQVIAVELNAFLRMIPAQLTLMAQGGLKALVTLFVRPAELLINRIRRTLGKEALDLTSGLSGVAEGMRERALADIAAWRALIEQETAAIVKAAEIVDETKFVAAPTDPGEDPATAAMERAAARRAQLRREESQIAQQEHERRLSDAERQAAELEVAKEAREEELEELGRRATTTATAMTGAFETFFNMSRSGFEATAGVWGAAGQAAREAGAAIVGGLVAGRVQEQTAAGVAALASGIWPPNPAAFLAASKHFAAAALFKAIPGAISGGGRGGSTGGFGGLGGAGRVPLPPGAVGSSGATAQPLGPEINIFLDQLSPSDPAFQRVVLGATQSAQERFGSNVRVNVRPRTGRL